MPPGDAGRDHLWILVERTRAMGKKLLVSPGRVLPHCRIVMGTIGVAAIGEMTY
jgi:hypothetical protein